MKSSARARSTRSLSATTKRKSPYFDIEGDDTTAATTIPKGTVGASSAIKSKSKGELIKTAKRKASSSSSKSPSSSSSKKKKKKKKPSTVVVERTQSFEPAWWGNVIAATSINKLHSHASTSNSTPTTKQSSSLQTTLHYPPVHTLILGTHPSIASLGSNQMFGHPLNAFWYIAGDCLGFRRCKAVSPTTGKPYVYYHDHLRYTYNTDDDDDNIIDYSQQLERMVSHGFSMWDIIAECEREGSLDQDIKQEVANPIREFCENNEHMREGKLKRICIANGTTGAKYFVKHFTDWFIDGKLCAADDEVSQRVFKVPTNKARKAIGEQKLEDDIQNGRLIEVVCLPGVSPAAAKFTYLEKRDAWERSCYGPGLADYQKWKQSLSNEIPKTTTVTPTKQKTKAKSPRKSGTPSSPSKVPAVRILSSDIATLAPEHDWVDLEVPAQELRPSATLTNGQCFNWIVVESDSEVNLSTPQKSAWGTHDAKEWIGPLGNRVICIKETPTTTLFRVLHGPIEGAKGELQQYFRLETPLAPLYKEWSTQDARLAKIATAIPGVRILRQDPVECMFSFICSSNNNIPRITKMLSSFREKYGKFMMEIPTQDSSSGVSGTLSLYSFPTLESLAGATEAELRDMGLGYRAKYIVETRDLLVESGGDDFLLKLRTQNDAQVVQEELIKFSGIGRKVADCVALFSLDSDDAIPVDVHVQHIESRDYDPSVLGEAKSITPTIYKRVGDLFRDRFEKKPGWAHSLLFVAELPSFRDVLPRDIIKEMDDWKELEQRKKQEKKAESKKTKIAAK